MTQSHSVAVIVGSLRAASLSRKVAHALIGLAPEGLDLKIIEIGDLALYNEELEASPPAPWTRFRDEMKAVSAVLFVTPEYNRSVPGALKNALDVGSRPYGQSIWGGKPGAIVSVSPGAMGAFGANHHLRQSLVFLDVPTLQQPEAYVGHAGALFDDQDNLTNEGTKGFLGGFMKAFGAWVQTNARA
ncbi:MAG: NAD(P)H-dependent oxidoreductase [Caulobacteraceae bacterium]|nr:NAD(P)H-dependent oxidoreductase [Caulobacteraceae bacterium]